MTDAFDRLKAALSDRYAIERELGAGGMATVYLAEDLKLHRKVALKVLRPELASALGPERFLREIDIAAKLNHPHILGLFDCGDADGFLYYVMPYVEGQSLRDRLATEGELPIPEAVRILRDVVEALKHAHRHNVVHRDIKPDNVMLAEDHALVTDFGVAKAVSDATGAVGLTTEGVALGTPAYMSPEQASADPHIDHRADIYAVGVIAYELLTGRTPFIGNAQQDLLAAHVTQTPDPVTKYRESVPPALGQLVAKCLEKKAADRWQTAEELLPQMEALATPSGGVTPTGMVPVTAVRRGWKLWTAIGAVVAVVAIVLGVLFSGGEPEGPPRLVVLPFENLGAPEDEYFADGMTEEITSRLARLSGIEVIARTSAIRYKSTEKTASQIAAELDVDYLLEGTVRWHKPAIGQSRIRVSPQLIRGSDETNEWAEPFEAAFIDVFSLQADVAERIAQALDVALLEHERRSLLARPTDDLEAYDAYLRGRVHWERRGAGLHRALERFVQAVELDPDFALAHAGVADASFMIAFYEDMPAAHVARARTAAQRALELDSSLAETHSSMALVSWGNWDWERAKQGFLRSIEINPSNAWVRNLWGQYLHHVEERVEEAAHQLERAVELDPLNAHALAILASILIDAGRLGEALDVLQRANELDPTLYHPYSSLVYLYKLQSRSADAVAVAEAEIEARGRDRWALNDLATALAFDGRLDEAKVVVDELISLSSREYVNPTLLARALDVVGRTDDAFHWLDRAYREREVGLGVFLSRIWWSEDVFNDPRFLELRRRVGLD